MKHQAVILLVAIGFASPLAQAGFAGLPLRADYAIQAEAGNAPDTFGYSTTIGAGVDYPAFPTGSPGYQFGDTPTFNVDVSDTLIQITNFDSSDTFTDFYFNGLVFADSASQLPAFNSFAVDTAKTTLDKFDASRLSFDDNHLRINLAGLSYEPSTVLAFDVGFASDPDGPPQPIPEPAGIALGVATLSLARRRRRARATPLDNAR